MKGRFANVPHRHFTSMTLMLTCGLVLACGAFFLPAIATATTARTTALGGRSDFFTDDANTRRWCAVVGDYPDLATLESGHFDLGGGYHNQWGAIVSGPGVRLHAKLDAAGRRGTLGFFLNGRQDDMDPGSLHHSRLAGSLEGIYARRCGPATLALQYRRASSTTDLADLGGPSTGVLKATRSDLGGGLRMNLGSRAMLDLAGELRGISQDVPAALANIADGALDGWGSFDLRGRAFIGLGDRIALVPVAEYIHEHFRLVQDFADGMNSSNIDRELVHLGLGLNFFANLDNMLVLSGEFMGAGDNAREGLPADSPGGQLIDQAIVLRLAFESRLNPWLTARGSAGLQTVTIDSPTGNLDADHVPLAVGLSAYAAHLALDVAVSDRLPSTLTNLALAPVEDEDSTWLIVNLRYEFRP